MASDRQNSLLTARNRQFLKGEIDDEITQKSANRMRYRMRKRIVNGLLDFWVLNEFLNDDTDLHLIFNPERGTTTLTDHTSEFPSHWFTVLHDQTRSVNFPTGASESEEPPNEGPSKATTVFELALTDLFSFCWKGVQRLPGVDFEHIVEEGITKAAKEHGKTANVEIELEDVDIDRLVEKVDSGDISGEELKLLLRTGPDVFGHPLSQAASEAEPDADRENPDPPEWMQERYDDGS